MRKEGYTKVVFTSLTNDAALCDQGLIRDTLTKYLDGLLTYSGHTDPNRNVKNGRYQFLIGGNNAKTVGIILIDTGALCQAKIAQDLW